MFKIFGNKKRMVSVADQCHNIFIPKFDAKEVFFINENTCLRAHIIANMFHYLKNFYTDFIVYGDVFYKIFRVLSLEQLNDWPINPTSYFAGGKSLFGCPDNLRISRTDLNYFDMILKVDAFWNNLGLNKFKYEFLGGTNTALKSAITLSIYYKDRRLELFTCGPIRDEILINADRSGCTGWALFIRK
uniref:Nucleotid_trans domain-containing protein n=1 Tax=Meloidogyne hapla TaxID=6305 RepID=A0A1I8B5C6_MELHA